MPWKKLLAWATGQVDEALRHKLEFVLEENRVYRTLLDPYGQIIHPSHFAYRFSGFVLSRLPR